MNKKLLLLPMLLVALPLVACADTDQLYPDGAYYTNSFVKNAYEVYEGKTKEAKANLAPKVLNNEENGYWNGTGELTDINGSPAKAYGFAQAKSWHPNYFKEGGKDLYWGYADGYSDITRETGIGMWADQSSLYGTIYSQTKKLARNNPAFSKGVLSKLYNGQIKCNAWSYFSMVLLSKEGYGTLFPKELSSAEYFAMSLRAGSDVDQEGPHGRLVSMDIGVTFYKLNQDNSLKAEGVKLSSVYLNCNYSSEVTSLVGFTFADAGISPKGIVGMSVDYTLVDDGAFEVGTEVTDNFKDEAKGHVGLCMLEVLFPDSNWN